MSGDLSENSFYRIRPRIQCYKSFFDKIYTIGITPWRFFTKIGDNCVKYGQIGEKWAKTGEKWAKIGKIESKLVKIEPKSVKIAPRLAK